MNGCLQAEYQMNSQKPGGSAVTSPIVESALKNLDEYRQRRQALAEQLTPPAGTPIEGMASYWMGVLEGTVVSLLILIQEDEASSS